MNDNDRVVPSKTGVMDYELSGVSVDSMNSVAIDAEFIADLSKRDLERDRITVSDWKKAVAMLQQCWTVEEPLTDEERKSAVDMSEWMDWKVREEKKCGYHRLHVPPEILRDLRERKMTQALRAKLQETVAEFDDAESRKIKEEAERVEP
jgi:hypothetical protein